MRLLSVAERELRCAARRKATYRARWLTALLFFGLLLWLTWAFGGFSNRSVAPQVFKVYAVLAFLYCLSLSAAQTADCISAERREGTLGLLFLTNLNSAEIMGGKFCSIALSSVYGLMAIFPMLSLPLMIGGITFGQVARTVLGMLGGILFALAAGFLASVVSKRQFTAVALALGLTFGLVIGPMIVAAGLNTYAPTRPFGHWAAAFSPLYTVLTADSRRFLGGNHYWLSAASVASLSLAGLAVTTLLLAGTWRDRPKRARAWPWLGVPTSSAAVPSAKRAALRRRLLGINPVFWLAARQPVSAPVFMCLAVLLTTLTVYVAAPFFGRVMGAGVVSPVAGHLFAWLWCGLIIHALVLYYAAMTASQRLAEDKQVRALELILSTPTSERTISRGLWLAYGRKMFFPALLAVLVHGFCIWMCMVLATMEAPGKLPPSVTPGALFWNALLNRPQRGWVLDWQFVFMLRIGLLFLLQMALSWLTLGWVSRWLGLRMKHPGFAPIAALAILCVPPVLLFSLACYLAVQCHLDRWPDWRFFPLMLWVAVGIGFGHCVVLSLWAASRLRRCLRAVGLSHYEPSSAWSWRLPSRRTIQRVAFATALFIVLVASLGAGYYFYQNVRAKWAWQTFQASLERGGESLQLAPLLPGPAPEALNFARSLAFAGLLNRSNHGAALLNRLGNFDLAYGGTVLTDWSRQTNALLQPYLLLLQQPNRSAYATNRAARASTRNRPLPRRNTSRAGTTTNRTEQAAAILQALESDNASLRELAGAAATSIAFQISTNRDVNVVLQPVPESIRQLERLHLIFQVRALAELASGRNADAAGDVLTGLRLAQLARQLPDARSTVRVQWLLARSLQPLWEGLSQRAWTEPQLAAFQRELGGFNLLADYTNAVRRVVLAHIELWRAIPGHTNPHAALLAADAASYLTAPGWQLQPRAWWFDNCIRLYAAGQRTIEQVDSDAGRIGNDWSSPDLGGLPLDQATLELLRQSLWYQASPASVAFAQTSVNQALVACALERFRLANGTYPPSLEPLAPVLLARSPHDAISGRPIAYQNEGGTNFILRGVGPNGVDDRKNKGSDDWLWTYPTNAPSVK